MKNGPFSSFFLSQYVHVAAPKALSIAGIEIGSDEPIVLLDQRPLFPFHQNAFQVV
jgi:hypothetical protein